MPETGVRTNAVRAGETFEFPAGRDTWLGLRDDAPVTTYTVLLSREPLAEPAFLADRAGRKLSAAEQVEWQAFVKRAAGVAVFEIPVVLEVGNGKH